VRRAPKPMPTDSLMMTARAGAPEPDGSAATDEIEVGKTIGRFMTLRRLGEGAMGVVYTGYDVDLDRKVALKVIRAEVFSAALRERLLREAQALAKLSHPNVVQIYEAGRHHQRLFVAMEYIDGQDLRRWLEAGRRPWPVVLSTICAAGRGLAAAHAIGLVHRDVKPDNILVGADGRARIADFGLVRSVEDDPTKDITATDHLIESVKRETGSGSRSARHLTQEGRSIGTPAYMAPEQHHGLRVDARSDQFSFCVTLYEGLYGVRPFTGATIEVLRDQVERGQIRPPPAGSAVPRWIHRLLLRGLDPAPSERWPTMTALLDALASDPGRRRRTIVGIVAAATLVGGGAYALASAQAEDALRCHGARELEGVWDEDRRAALATAWASNDGALTTETLPRVRSLLDTYAERWTDQHNHTCETHRRGETSPLLLDRSMACLRRRHQALSALVQVLLEDREGTLTSAVEAATSLPRIEHCGDAEALLAAVPPPEDHVRATEVEAIRDELARAHALESAGRYVDGLALVDGLVPRVEAVEYAPLVAELHLQRGRIHLWSTDFAAADIELHKAFVLGLGARADGVAAEALIRWIFIKGDGLNQPREALNWEPVAQAMVRRLPEHEELAVLLANNTGAVLESIGALEKATTSYREALEGWVRTVGSDHPQTLYSRANLGLVLLKQGRCVEGQQAIEGAIAGMLTTLGASHPILLITAANRCLAHDCLGEPQAALQCYDAALAALDNLPWSSAMGMAVFRIDRANARLNAGDIDGAEADFFWFQKQAPDDRSIDPRALVGLAWIDLLRGEVERARTRYQAAIDALERSDAPGHLRIEALAGLGEALLARGEVAVARTHLESTLTFAQASTPYPWFQAPARFALALALAAGAAPEDRERARVLAGEARDGYAVGGHSHDGERARIAQFLANLDRDPVAQ